MNNPISQILLKLAKKFHYELRLSFCKPNGDINDATYFNDVHCQKHIQSVDIGLYLELDKNYFV